MEETVCCLSDGVILSVEPEGAERLVNWQHVLRSGRTGETLKPGFETATARTAARPERQTVHLWKVPSAIKNKFQMMVFVRRTSKKACFSSPRTVPKFPCHTSE